MKYLLTPAHKQHAANLGVERIPHEIEIPADEYVELLNRWRTSSPNATRETLHEKVIGHWLHRQMPVPEPEVYKPSKWTKPLMVAMALAILILAASQMAHCQFSKVNSVTVTDGTHNAFFSYPFTIDFSGCTVTPSGGTVTVSCAGGAANPGLPAFSTQCANSGATGFSGIALGNAGQVLISNGTSSCAAFADPIVSGPTANGVAPSATNPVWVAGWDGTNVHAISTDAIGRVAVNVNGTVPVSGTFWQATQPVSGTFWQATQPVSIATMPSTPVTGTFWQATQPVTGTFFQATQPVSIADGSSATLGAKADAKSTATDLTPITIMQVLKEISAMAQAPAPTPVTGTFWQATQPVSGTVTANAGTGTFNVGQATGTNLHMVCDSGCSSSAGFGDNAAFTAGTTAINPVGGWYSTSPTNCTSGSACAAQLTIDRKMFVQSFQGTSPWVDSITTWGGGTLGAMANYGTSPGAVLVPGVNSFITNVPHFVCDSGCASGGSSTPADTFSNPATAGLSMGFSMLWNGTTWDRQYGDKTNGAFVNVKTSVLPTGAALDSSLTTLDTDLKANVTLHAGTNVIGHVIVDSGAVNATLGAETTKVIGTVNQGTSPWVTSSTLAAETTKVIGTVNQGTSPWVASATLAAETTKVIGTARVVGNTGAAVDAATNGAIPTNQVWVVNAASSAAGSAVAACNIVSAASTNATLCKNATGNFFGFEIFNTTTTVYYLRLYNLTTAPTCSSATGFIRSIPIPPASAAGQVGGAVSNQTYPTPYGTGISYCITGGSAGTDNTNAAVGIFGEIRYE